MNGMSRIEYELRAQLDTVKELRNRLESVLEILAEQGADSSDPLGPIQAVCELDDMLSDYIDAVKAAQRKA